MSDNLSEGLYREFAVTYAKNLGQLLGLMLLMGLVLLAFAGVIFAISFIANTLLSLVVEEPTELQGILLSGTLFLLLIFMANVALQSWEEVKESV